MRPSVGGCNRSLGSVLSLSSTAERFLPALTSMGRVGALSKIHCIGALNCGCQNKPTPPSGQEGRLCPRCRELSPALLSLQQY